MAVAADVPSVFDVVINGQGYRFLDALERAVSTYGSRALATYTRSQTFVERSNVAGNYGDNQQDFFLTASQHDFSLGEGQRYYIADDPTSSRRYYYSSARGLNIDRPGEVTMRHTEGVLAANTIIGAAPRSDGLSAWFATASNLKHVDSQGTITDHGAHTVAGALTDATFSVVDDGTNVFVSGQGATNIRSFNGTAFSTFSASPALALAYADNSLYGIQQVAAGGSYTATFQGRYVSPTPPPYLKTYVTGSFQVGETVTQTTSAATGTVAAYNASTGVLTITPGAGVFVSGGSNTSTDATYAITGSTSGAVGYHPSVVSTASAPLLQLNRYATDGTATAVSFWKDAKGKARNLNILRMLPTGGTIKMLFRSGNGGEIWEFDGDASTLVAALPSRFIPYDMALYGGVIYVSGQIVKASGASTALRKPAVYYYSNGSWGLLWQADDFLSGAVDVNAMRGPGICSLDDGIAFVDPYTNLVKYYNGSTAAISALSLSNTADDSTLTGVGSFFLLADYTTGTGNNFVWPQSAYGVQGALHTSMYDFGSSLNKFFRSVKIDAVIPAGASIDVNYRLEDPTASSTTLQNGITPGTEIPINLSGHSIGFAIILNKGSSASGPTLKRISVRTAPALLAFRSAEYHLDLSGRDGKQMIPLRNGQSHSKDGLEMATDIRSASSAGVISITDRFGTYNGVIEAHEFDEFRPEEFVGTVQVREV